MAREAEKVIISCAVTGSIHTPSMSPHLPVTPDEVAEQAIGAAEAGAAILHLHARDPKDGRPTPDPEVFMQFLPRIKQATSAVVNISTGGGQGMSLDQRLAASMRAKPEMCSLNMGSMNFGLFPMAQRERDWKHAWEKQHLEGSRDAVFKNTFADIERVVTQMSAEGARFEFECYDVSHLYTLSYFLERGLVKAPLFVQFVMGVLGGIGAEPEHLVHLKQTADRLFGDTYCFSTLAAGKAQMRLVTLSAILGGHVRVGLEDSLYMSRGRLAKNNAEQVARIRELVEGLSLDIASPDDARAMLDLKGGDQVAF